MIQTEGTTAVSNDSSIPDPDMSKMKPIGNKVIIRELEPEAKTAGGIILAESTVEDFTRRNVIGRVLAISETAHDPKYHMSNSLWYDVGDYIAVAKIETTRIPMKKGLTISLVDYDRAMAVFSDIEDLDFYGYRLKR